MSLASLLDQLLYSCINYRNQTRQNGDEGEARAETANTKAPATPEVRTGSVLMKTAPPMGSQYRRVVDRTKDAVYDDSEVSILFVCYFKPCFK